jgi:hypothetical protein
VTGLLVFGTWRACSKLFLRRFKPWVSSFGSPWGLLALELLVLFFTVLPAACMSCSGPCFMARLTRRAPRATLRRTSACASEDSAPCSSEYSSSSALKPAGSDMDAEADSGEEALNERVGYLLRGSPVRVVAPDEFLDPVTDCLILEPVTLLNTNTTVDRLTLQEWLRAGERPARVPLALCLCCLCCLGRAVACSPATCASCHQAASCLS